jgi:predicted metalloprotease
VSRVSVERHITAEALQDALCDIHARAFTHGTSEQRQSWFMKGFETGQMSGCDTFSGDR